MSDKLPVGRQWNNTSFNLREIMIFNNRKGGEGKNGDEGQLNE